MATVVIIVSGRGLGIGTRREHYYIVIYIINLDRMAISTRKVGLYTGPQVQKQHTTNYNNKTKQINTTTDYNYNNKQTEQDT